MPVQRRSPGLAAGATDREVVPPTRRAAGTMARGWPLDRAFLTDVVATVLLA